MSKSIVAVVVDVDRLTLYHDDGSTLRIPQGDPRVEHIVEKVIPKVDQGIPVEADYSESSFFGEFEKQTSGVIRFFRAFKKNVKAIFSEPGHDTNVAEVGSHGVLNPSSPSTKAINEIMANATPVTSENFKDADTTNEHTMIAVVGDKIIPGVETLKDQIKSSVRGKNTVGMENFLKRIGAVIDQRRHSIEDVLRFLERGDLPIADDGSIIAYKLLNKRSDGDRNYYVDCHTGRVKQRVGSFVFMKESMVDPNRRNECSQGLHVARRRYLRSFSGDVCVLVKIAPEDFIAVPEYDANKVRVSGYHILFELSNEARKLLQSDQSMTTLPDAQKMLSGALRGVHPPIDQLVEITEAKGGGVIITNIKAEEFNRNKLHELSGTRSLDHQVEVTVDPRRIAETVAKPAPAPKPKTSTAPVKAGISRKEQARQFMNVLHDSTDPAHRYQAAQNLLAHKKAAKVGWGVLGISDAEVKYLTETAEAGPPKVAEVATKVATKAAESMKTAKQDETRQQRIDRLVAVYEGLNNATLEQQVAAAQELIDIQKIARKSWSLLGQGGLNNAELQGFIDEAAKIAKANPPKKQAKASKPKVSAAKPVSESGSTETRQEKARRLFKANDWAGLRLHKKTAKIGWDRLGFTAKEIEEIKRHG